VRASLVGAMLNGLTLTMPKSESPATVVYEPPFPKRLAVSPKQKGRRLPAYRLIIPVEFHQTDEWDKCNSLSGKRMHQLLRRS
jgi:hypothetical protein